MAGAGYKLFNTGDVLTAAQVNTYLNEQTVMVFADSAARTTALSGVLAEGMVSYLQDTNAVEVYNGSAWVGLAADQTPLTTKGDLFTFSTVDARLAVGNNGETLVADSSTSTGLRWQGDYAAGKNKIINGDFKINQRGFTSVTTNGTYFFDRYISRITDGGGTVTITPQVFTPGTAPVSGYEGSNYVRVVSSGQVNTDARAGYDQRIESVRTFAGQTITVSFWAKANTGTPSIAVEAVQAFGSGGSPSSTVTGSVAAGTVVKKAITTSWARYSFTLTIPSIAGKTLGTTFDGQLEIITWLSAGSTLNTRTDSLGIQNNTFEIWGVQAEAGSVATPFQTATGTLAGELAACQRYYYRASNGGNANSGWGMGFGSSTTMARIYVTPPVTMRVVPTAVDFSTLCLYDGGTQTSFSSMTIAAGDSTSNFVQVQPTVGSGLTQYRPYFINSFNSSNGFLGLSAEL
jgi:hypothetical protein